MSKKFNHVSEDAFIAVEGPLKAAGWERLKAPITDANAQVLALAASLIFGGIEHVRQHLIPIDREGLDAAWDRAQRRFTAATLLKMTDPDLKVAAAAERICATLLWEGGQLGLTQLTYEAEVDFGLRQIEIADSVEIAPLLLEAGLLPILNEVRVATKAFEAGLGRAPDKKRSLAPAHMRRDAIRDAARRFALAYGMVEALIAELPSGPEVTSLRLLLAPLDRLVERS